MSPPPSKVLCVQPSAIVDHVCNVTPEVLHSLVGDAIGGSRVIDYNELKGILACVGEFQSKAGGSASNVARSLTVGYGVQADVIGARGNDEWGVMFISSMKRGKVGTDKVSVQDGKTGRSAVLVCNGERTMRTCMSESVYQTAAGLHAKDFEGYDWVFLSAYGFYGPGLLQRAAELAKSAGARVVLDLGSYEIVKSHFESLVSLIRSGLIFCLICNEDEANMFYSLLRDSGQISSGQCVAVSSDPFDAASCAAASATVSAKKLEDDALFESVIHYAFGGMGMEGSGEGSGGEKGVKVAVVTKGNRGCLVGVSSTVLDKGVAVVKGQEDTASAATAGVVDADGSRGQIISVPAVPGVPVVDSTGAGDNFTAGFIYGLMTRGHEIFDESLLLVSSSSSSSPSVPSASAPSSSPPNACLSNPPAPLAAVERIATVACLAGAAAVQVLGSELSDHEWRWFHSRLNGDLAAEVVNNTAEEVHQELLQSYALIEKLGRGVVYFGSARLGQESPFWTRAVSLSQQIAQMLKVPTWTGGGPGMMRAASEGALAAGQTVGAIRISKEAGTSVLTMSKGTDLLPAGSVFTCKHMPARKVALTDAGTRVREEERTAFVFLPGGLGTMDELFSILTLVQLKKLGAEYNVPIIVVNYDGFYDGLLHLLTAFDRSAALVSDELKETVVTESNEQVLQYLAKFYGLPTDNLPACCLGEGYGQLCKYAVSAEVIVQAAAAAPEVAKAEAAEAAAMEAAIEKAEAVRA